MMFTVVELHHIRIIVSFNVCKDDLKDELFDHYQSNIRLFFFNLSRERERERKTKRQHTHRYTIVTSLFFLFCIFCFLFFSSTHYQYVDLYNIIIGYNTIREYMYICKMLSIYIILKKRKTILPR